LSRTGRQRLALTGALTLSGSALVLVYQRRRDAERTLDAFDSGTALNPGAAIRRGRVVGAGIARGAKSRCRRPGA
jgi:hypothetical protein